MTNPTRAEIITAAVDWLKDGLLPSAVPTKIMQEFLIPREQASPIAIEAIQSWRKRTKPLKPGD
jgi:hypothetical protein